MGVARISVASELVLDALGFPEQTAIRGARMSDDGRDVILVVEHEALKTTRIEGAEPPIAVPSFRHRNPVVLVDWGLR